MSQPLVLTKRSDVRQFVCDAKKKGGSVGFVPTMGALHEGHGTLLRRSVQENDATILSVFVNPKQFGPNEDFSRYPRSFAEDCRLAGEAGVTAVFAPSVQEMYPEGFETSVTLRSVSSVLCGAFRPGHFDGVATVVLLLLNLMQADRAYFGMKDFQQLALIRRMCRDLAHPTEILGVPTVRESDGLAMSSRNRYLDDEARQKATAIPYALAQTAAAFLDGERNSDTLTSLAMSSLQKNNLTPQYLELRDVESFTLCESDILQPAVLAVAQYIDSPGGTTRLIDNIVLSDDSFHRPLLEELIGATRQL